MVGDTQRGPLWREGGKCGVFRGAAREGKDFFLFDEFSTALLFFLILKKAFFVVFYAVCQKKEKLGNNEKTTLIFPGKNRLNYETKNKNFHDGTFNFFFFWSNQKNFFQPRKEPTLNVCIFFTLFYSFFFAGGCFISFLDASIASGLKRGFFFFYERCVFWAGGAGVKIRQKSCFLCRGFLL